MAPLFQIPSFFQGSYTPSQPANCCCGGGNQVNVNVGEAPPTVGAIIGDGGFVVRRTDEAGRLIAAANNGTMNMFQGV